MNRLLTSIYVDDLSLSKDFYLNLLGLVVVFEADWIVQLSDRNNENINLSLQLRNHDLIPERYRKKPAGFSIAFVVDDSDKIYSQALKLKLDIVQPPKNENYGQRRFLIAAPEGTLVDVCSPCDPSPDFIAKYFGDNNT